MSKRKQLIQNVFERIKETSEKDTKYGWSDDLADAIEKKIKFKISSRTLSRYYDAYIDGIDEEKGIETLILNRLSQYLGFNDYEDFCTTIEKKGENASKTIVKIGVDNNEASSISGGTGVNISIINTNEVASSGDNERDPGLIDRIKENGLGILEMTFVLLMVMGGVVFSNNKGSVSRGLISNWDPITVDKPFMYWDGDRYMATDSSSLGPQIDVIPMDKFRFKYFKKITRPDTLNATNSMGKVWYDKTNNNVEFFTSYGKHPINDKALKDVSERILNHYAGYQQSDSIEVE
ncbi:hypothetical protein PFY12_09025 [Chryseobacterium camelliae]|uniref:Uncharacterized protein n=1 Tax=Chryseobacterium camelliae TaxID=1265445 RepID=A0ABY7QIU8_9FLAO|nr:hypothetical protein [Chryseobacterium camelliae]WBV59203.1 hypothetical protein PFY12_09025 [Chryseobacterium camelliae]